MDAIRFDGRGGFDGRRGYLGLARVRPRGDGDSRDVWGAVEREDPLVLRGFRV